MMSAPTPLSARAQAVIAAVIAVLAVAALSPLADAMVPAIPLATGEVRWRFQVFGTFLAALPQLALLLASIAGLGTLAGHRVAVRAASVAALVCALVAILLLPFFGLDFIEMRRLVPIDRKATFDLATMKTGLFGGLFFLVLAYMGWSGWKASVKERTTERKEGQGLVVGQG
ncbi:MAG: hypothetical protein V9E87_09990 [Gemmatimonadales bacterium]